MYMQNNKMWSVLRIALGFVFLWAFLDKLFGLGFATTPEKSWLAGGSPTFGFLNFAVKGPFASFYHSIASSVLVEWLYSTKDLPIKKIIFSEDSKNSSGVEKIFGK